MDGLVLDRAVLNQLRAIGDGEDDLLAEVVTLFINVTPAQLGELRAALEGRDGPAAHRLAHGLKGSARSVGARQVGDIAAAIEAAAQAGDIDGASAASLNLDAAFATAREALKREIS